jgi:hypothetical protein
LREPGIVPIIAVVQDHTERLTRLKRVLRNLDQQIASSHDLAHRFDEIERESGELAPLKKDGASKRSGAVTDSRAPRRHQDH